MTTKNRITAAAAALAIAGVLAACSTPAPEPTVEPAPVVADEPTEAPEPTVEPEPTAEPEPELLPVPAEVIEKAKEVGGEARKTNADMLKKADEIVRLANETYEKTGRKLVFITEGGSYGWEGELLETFYTFAKPFPELQIEACSGVESDTVKGAIKAAEKCIALQADPSIYEIVVTV